MNLSPNEKQLDKLKSLVGLTKGRIEARIIKIKTSTVLSPMNLMPIEQELNGILRDLGKLMEAV